MFPLFIAGMASCEQDAKGRAVDLITVFEGKGIGQNTLRTRQLLVAVCEEQNRIVDLGGRMVDVDWLVVARERGLLVLNCGL